MRVFLHCMLGFGVGDGLPALNIRSLYRSVFWWTVC